MDTSTLLWLTGLVLAICGTIALVRRRNASRELAFDSELEDTNTWIATIGKVKGEPPVTPPRPAEEPGVVRTAPVTRTDETVAFRYPEPAGDRPKVHRFTPDVGYREPEAIVPAYYQEPEVLVPQYREPDPDDTVYRLLPDTESFSVIPAFTSAIQADTDLEIARQASDMERFMRDLLGAEAYAYASEAVDRAGGPRAILGGSWTP